MSSINKIFISGRVTHDLVKTEIKAGLTACRLSIATEHKTRNKEGVENKEVCFIDATVWNKMADECMKFFKKGSQITVEGRLKLDKWTDKKTGQERTKHAIAIETIIWPEKELEIEKPEVKQDGFDFDTELPF